MDLQVEEIFHLTIHQQRLIFKPILMNLELLVQLEKKSESVALKSGDGVVSTSVVTVTTDTALSGVDVDTPIRIQGVNSTGYDGPFVISEVVSSTEVKYQVQNPPSDALPGVTDAKLNIQSDTVTSASPYIFNISLRSVFGMNGLFADGDKADGFKSMMVDPSLRASHSRKIMMHS